MKKPVFVKGKNSSRYNLTHDSERLEGDRTISPVRGKIGSAMGSNRVALERPFSGRRSAVLADSDELDSWRRDSAFWKKKDWDILASVQRARELRAEVKAARELMRSRMSALRKELAEIRKKRGRRPRQEPIN